MTFPGTFGDERLSGAQVAGDLGLAGQQEVVSRKKPAVPGPRPHLRRGSLPGPHDPRSPRHGHLDFVGRNYGNQVNREFYGISTNWT